MSYHNYRVKKEKGLVKLNKRTIINVVENESGVNEEKEEARFDLEVKRFSEEYGTPCLYPEKVELDIEALEKEKVLLQGFIEDINELLADIESLRGDE